MTAQPPASSQPPKPGPVPGPPPGPDSTVAQLLAQLTQLSVRTESADAMDLQRDLELLTSIHQQLQQRLSDVGT